MTAPGVNAVEARGLTVAFGQTLALDAASLSASQGMLTAVTGASGSGKTTLVLALAGELAATGGEVLLGAGDVPGLTALATVPQEYALATILTAHENVALPLLTDGVPPAEAGARAEEMLAQLGLEDLGNHLVEELSGGQQQRVAVARALARRPAVLLADEPTSALDAANRERVVALLRDHAHAGATVLITTNDPDAAAAADRQVTLHEGRVVPDAPR